jgi:hypothetical protein
VANRLVARGAEYLLQMLGIAVMLSLTVDVSTSHEPPTALAVLEPRDVETIVGTVSRVRVLPGAGGAERDVVLVVRTDIGEDVSVAVAPRRIVKSLGLHLRRHDDVQVLGWRIVRGKPALLAAEITTRWGLFVLRDRHGNPVWLS